MNELKTVLFCLSFVPSIVFFGYLIQRYLVARRHRPQIAKADIVYQENFASGASQKNLLTKLGGARNCLRLVVTDDLLWVTSWPPFSLLTAFYDLEHVIPLKNISSVESDRHFSRDTLLLSYRDGMGNNHILRLIPKDLQRFLSAIQLRPTFPEATQKA